MRRIVQTYCGKNRVKNDTTAYLWCIVVSLIEEIISHATGQNEGEDEKNVRVTTETIVSSISVQKLLV